VEHNMVTRSRNHCYSGNTIMNCVFVVQLRDTVSYVQILSFAQQCFYVGGSNKTHVDIHVKGPMFELKKSSFAYGLLYM
jgi:hypothetical protein